MRKLIVTLTVLAAPFCGLFAETITVNSPDNRIRVEVSTDNCLRYSVYMDDKCVMEQNRIAIQTTAGVLGEAVKVKSVRRESVDRTVSPLTPYKNRAIVERYNGATITLAGNYSVEFRAFDNGVAYRFLSDRKGEMTVTGEVSEFCLPDKAEIYLSLEERFQSMYERPYTIMKASEYKINDKMSYLPVLATTSEWRMLITETDLYDYPAMFLRADGGSVLKSTFPKVPCKFTPRDARRLNIVGETEYIAKTEGRRSFPWRVATLVRDDKSLLESNLSYLLAREDETGTDWSWIRPGMVSWDWWHHMQLTGVDFRAGINTQSYKYYIDFAADYKIPYIILDEGWSKDSYTPFELNPEVDLPELLRYAASKGVKLILWVSWLAVENNFDAIFKTYADWGVAGMKIDFMDRSDQTMINFYERTVRAAAEHKLFIDFHGSITPKGLERRFPNLLSYEGVLGLEQGPRCKPQNSNYLPFIRNVLGPMDFTPGSMMAVHSESNHSVGEHCTGTGTRAYQMALYVVFESGLQMLADSPSFYRRESECTEFIASTPVTWDETRVIKARLGNEVVLARRKGDVWYLGAITAGEPCTIDVDLDFLSEGNYTLTSFEDGINADRKAIDYKKCIRTVKSGDSLHIKMVFEGGWVGRFEKQQ